MKRKFALFNFIFNIILYFSLFYLAMFFFMRFLSISWFNLYLMVEIMVCFGLVALNFKYLKKQFNLVRKAGWKKPIVFTAIAYISYIAVSFVFYGIMGEPESSSNQYVVEYLVDSTFIPLSLLFIVFTGPLKEELLYRVSIFHLFAGKNIGKADKKLKLIAAIFSASYFAFLHVIEEFLNFTDFYSLMMVAFPYILMGTIMVVLYVKGKYNIFYPLSFHIFNNLVAYIIMVMF